MSAYITRLDILGFGGSVAAWTRKVNTIEEGVGSGSNAMSAECFTLDTSPISTWGDFSQLEIAEVFSDRIRLNKSVWNQGEFPVENYVVEFYLTMTVTPAFSGLFPDSMIVTYIGDTFGGYHINNSINFSLVAYDSDGIPLAEHYVNYGDIESISPPLDIEVAIPLVYPEGSSGLHHIAFDDGSVAWV